MPVTNARDISRDDFDALAAEWQSQPIPMHGGFRILVVKEPCEVTNTSGDGVGEPMTVEQGAPGDLVIDHRQKNERHIVPRAVYDFLFFD